jgi:hypothetical protein
MLEAWAQRRAEREQQGVVREPVASFGVHRSMLRIEPIEGVLFELNPDVARDLIQCIVSWRPVREWLAHRHRSIHELGRGCQHRRADPLPCQLPQRQRRLEPPHAGPGEQYLQRLWTTRCHIEQARP